MCNVNEKQVGHAFVTMFRIQAWPVNLVQFLDLFVGGQVVISCQILEHGSVAIAP